MQLWMVSCSNGADQRWHCTPSRELQPARTNCMACPTCQRAYQYPCTKANPCCCSANWTWQKQQARCQEVDCQRMEGCCSLLQWITNASRCSTNHSTQSARVSFGSKNCPICH